MHQTLDAWGMVGVDFRSVREGFDTPTALGRLLLNLLASLAEFELEVLSERVRAGMDQARRQGRHIGRPPIAVPSTWPSTRAQIEAGLLSRRAAAKTLGTSERQVRRWLRTVKGAAKAGLP